MVEQSTERYARLSNGIKLCYDTFGDCDAPCLLLIMGLGGPLTWWSPDLCRLLAERGFFVVRYDNRDVGRSTKLTTYGGRRGHVVKGFVSSRAVLPRAIAPYTPPYTLSDMASDAVGLLDHLGVDRVHTVGVSMGGMIAQTVAIDHPHRVASLVSIMSTTGRQSVGWQDPRLIPRMLGRGRHSRETYMYESVRTWQAIGSPAYPISVDEARDRAAETFDRGISPSGVIRQIQAVLAQPDRSAALRGVTAPTLVIHGLADRLVHVSGGRATARTIPGSELLLIPGMGHDMPRALWPVLIDGIVRTAKRAQPPTSEATSASSSSSSSRR